MEWTENKTKLLIEEVEKQFIAYAIVQLLKQFYCARKLRHKLPQFIAVCVMDLLVIFTSRLTSGSNTVMWTMATTIKGCDTKPHPEPHCRVLPPGEQNDHNSIAAGSWKLHNDDSCNHFRYCCHVNKHSNIVTDTRRLRSESAFLR